MNKKKLENEFYVIKQISKKKITYLIKEKKFKLK